MRLVVWALLLIWFAWFAYVRWTTPPAALSGSLRTRDGDNRQEIAELEAAASALPVYRPTTTAPWTQWEQAELMHVALRGKWDPVARPKLAAIVTHFSSAAVGNNLDRIAALCENLREKGEDRLQPSQGAGMGFSPFSSVYSLNNAAAALLVRSRLRLAGQQDLAGALSDLKAARYLKNAIPRSAWSAYAYITPAGGASPLTEAIFLAQEVDLPSKHAADLIHLLSNSPSLSVSDVLARAVLHSGATQAFLDQHYTDDGRGNGWLVLSSLEIDLFAMPGSERTTGSGFWNLFSPLFNDRRTVAAKLTGFDERFRGLDPLGFDAAVAALRQHARDQPQPSVLDGPLAGAVRAFDPDAMVQLLEDVAWRRAAVVMVALSAYKHDHGEYPVALSALVPDYLEELPYDLITNAHFAYERNTPDSFRLCPATESPPEMGPHPYSTNLAFGARHQSLRLTEYSIKRPAEDE